MWVFVVLLLGTYLKPCHMSSAVSIFASVPRSSLCLILLRFGVFLTFKLRQTEAAYAAAAIIIVVLGKWKKYVNALFYFKDIFLMLELFKTLAIEIDYMSFCILCL